MKIKHNGEQLVVPTLGLYARDKTTLLGVLPPTVGDFTLNVRLNTVSEISFLLPQKIFSTVTGKSTNLAIFSKIKKGVLIKSIGVDNVFNVPSGWSGNEVNSHKSIGINWWVVTNVEETNESGKDVISVTATSYEHTLKERKVALVADVEDKKQILRLAKPYVISFCVPRKTSETRVDDTGHTVYKYRDLDSKEVRVWWYSPNGAYEDITYDINFSVLQTSLTENEPVELYFNTYAEIVELFYGTYNTDTHLFSGGLFSADIIADRLYTETDYNEREIILSIKNALHYWQWAIESTGGHFKVLWNGGSFLSTDADATIPLDDDLHLSFDEWNTVENIVESAQNIWEFGYVSPDLYKKFRTLDNTNENVYSFIFSTVCKKFNCFCICDCSNNTLNFYSQEDLFGNNSNIFLSYQTLIKQAEISTSDKEVITCCHVASADETDYSIAYVNPLGSNKLYNFGDYKQYLTDEIKTKIINWNVRVTAFEKLYKRLAFLRLYYIQTYTYWYSKMSEALTEYESVIDQINIGIRDKVINHSILSSKYSVGDKIPLIPSVALQIRDNDLDLNIDKDDIYDNQGNYIDTYFALQDIKLSDVTGGYNVYDDLVDNKLPTAIKNYYQMRWNYIGTYNRFLAVMSIAQSVYNICKMNNVYSANFLNKIAKKKVKQLSQYSDSINSSGSIYVFHDNFRSGNKSMQVFFACLARDDYTNLFNPSFYDLTCTKVYRNYVPSIKNYFTDTAIAIINSDTFEDKMFTSAELGKLDHYIIEGTYTDNNTVFSDLSADDTTIKSRHVSTKNIVNELYELYRQAKRALVIFSKQQYDFSISTINIFVPQQLGTYDTTGNDYTNSIYLGSILNAEIKRNQWESPAILGISVSYSDSKSMELTCSNNYRTKPLAYRFEELYNDISISEALSTDYTSDWYDN